MRKLSELKPDDKVILFGDAYVKDVESVLDEIPYKKNRMWLAEKQDLLLSAKDIRYFLEAFLFEENFLDEETFRLNDYLSEKDMTRYANIMNMKLKNIEYYVMGEEIEDDRETIR